MFVAAGPRGALLPLALVAWGALAAACGSKSTAPGATPSGDGGAAADAAPADAAPPSYPVVTLPAEPQRAGDPKKGYQALVNAPYVPCGIPRSAYDRVFSAAPADSRLPDRDPASAALPYNFTAYTTKEGVALVTSNCLSCHAGRLQGKLVVGLGDAAGDFTSPVAQQKQIFEAVGLLLTDPKEIAEWQKWKERVTVVAPYNHLDTRGPNPADAFTATLFAHHDRKTLAWLTQPALPVPPPQDLPVDVPPWWRMAKKNTMFYVSAGRGDHARHMMTASILCISSVAEAEAIDAWFGDVRAYIASLAPPKYPFPIDQAKAARGKTVFDATCSRCHGTHGAGGSYPNRLISLPEIGTDGLLASGTAQFAGPFVEWHNQSFFGQTARLEPQQGYVAPPLDGIWATAPFLHNGSVPTIAALLDSTKRPRYWTRTFDSSDLDQVGIGWNFTVVDHGKDGESDGKKKAELYDTTRPGYGNAGHTFGDRLGDEDRASVLEYLKTL